MSNGKYASLRTKNAQEVCGKRYGILMPNTIQLLLYTKRGSGSGGASYPSSGAGEKVPYVNENDGKFWRNSNHRDNRWNSNDRVVVRYSSAFSPHSMCGVFLFLTPLPAVQHPSYFLGFLGERYEFRFVYPFHLIQGIEHKLQSVILSDCPRKVSCPLLSHRKLRECDGLKHFCKNPVNADAQRIPKRFWDMLGEYAVPFNIQPKHFCAHAGELRGGGGDLLFI